MTDLDRSLVRDLIGALRGIDHSITADVMPSHDATGGNVASLSEAVMGMTAGLCKIADSISDLAEAVREGYPGPVDQNHIYKRLV